MTNEEISSSITAINVRLDNIEETLGKIEKSLSGNGTTGLITRLAKLEERLDGTWKTLLIIGWLFNFGIGAAALVAAMVLK